MASIAKEATESLPKIHMVNLGVQKFWAFQKQMFDPCRFPTLSNGAMGLWTSSSEDEESSSAWAEDILVGVGHKI